jgi:RIO-like serine/threonine protein kinase
MATKIEMFTKVFKDSLEIELQDIASKHGFAPRIQRIDGNVVQMDSVNGMCLADLYTDDPKKVPDWIWTEIHRILSVLFECEGIEYIDITGYNFMLEEETKKVWIIDFGDAYYSTTPQTDNKKPINWFLREVLDGEKSWNPDFA